MMYRGGCEKVSKTFKGMSELEGGKEKKLILGDSECSVSTLINFRNLNVG
jgi:hypothetical protein